MGSQFGPLPPGAAPYAPSPSSPRGLYREFGPPERPLRIHFPTDNAKTSDPWYWWISRVQPSYFSFLFTRWVRQKSFPVIKILQIDTQPIVPTPFVGFTTIEQAIAGFNPDIFGRFDEREQKFWDLIAGQGNVPKTKPPFNVVKGQIQSRDGRDIRSIIRDAINQFKVDFDKVAADYNQIAAGVSGTGGFHYPGQVSPFNFPLPEGPPTTISRFNQQLSAFVQGPPYLQSAAYIGPVSATAFFNINTFTTQAQAFEISVGQLDPKKWNMAVFPPVEASGIGNGISSSKSGNYSGYGPVPFPLHGLEIM